MKVETAFVAVKDIHCRDYLIDFCIFYAMYDIETLVLLKKNSV